MLLKHYLDQGVTRRSWRTALAGTDARSTTGFGRVSSTGTWQPGRCATGRRPAVTRKLDPYRGIIESRQEAHPKLSAQRLFDEILKTGYDGGLQPGSRLRALGSPAGACGGGGGPDRPLAAPPLPPGQHPRQQLPHARASGPAAGDAARRGRPVNPARLQPLECAGAPHGVGFGAPHRASNRAAPSPTPTSGSSPEGFGGASVCPSRLRVPPRPGPRPRRTSRRTPSSRGCPRSSAGSRGRQS